MTREANAMDERAVAAKSSIEAEIVRTTLAALTDEVGAVVANTAPTLEISQAREFAVAITDRHGAVVAIDNPLQVASMAQTVARVADYFEFDLHQGDVILTNDPYAGGSRLHDVTLTAPLMVDDQLLLFWSVRIRIGDVGGQVGGSINPDATEILAEGHPYTPVKIQRRGSPVRDMLYFFLINGRHLQQTRRALDVASAALSLGQQRLTELVDRYSASVVRGALAYAQSYSEQLARAAIRAWQRGSFAGEQTLNLDAATGGPVVVRLAATVEADGLILDFSGSDDQRQVFVNCPAGMTASCALSAVLAMLGDAIPANSGLLRVIQVRTRPGSVVHPIQPAPVGWGTAHCANEVIDVVTATLRAAVAQPMAALTAPRPLLLSRPVTDRSHQTDLGRWGIGGASGLAGRDGWGPPQLSTRAQLPSVEQWEAEHAMRIEHLEFAEDSVGHGQWRGAPGVEVRIALAPGHLFTLWTQTAANAVAGLAGGRSGGPGEVAFHTKEGWAPAPRVALESAMGADRLRLRLSGGGGYGKPADRHRAAVLGDLADGLISGTTARDVYGLSFGES